MIAAFLTGHSVRGCHGLSAAQVEFQRRSPLPADCWLGWNFPYTATAPFPPRVSLVTASLNNLAHYYASRSKAFRARHRDAVVRAFSGRGPVVVVAGSCGLELLANLRLPGEVAEALHVFAIGPVSRSLPRAARVTLVQGRRDRLSRWFHRRPDVVAECGHMDYLVDAGVQAAFDDFCRSVLSP